jgi:hypothetical protein
MQFRHLHPSDLEGPIDLPGLRDWVAGLTPQDATLLITAPAGTGKTAAVGAIAKQLGRDVVLCNLKELLDAPDNAHQLENLLIACESHTNHVVFLDRLDHFLEAWDLRHPNSPGGAATVISNWLRKRRDNLVAAAIAVVLVGRNADRVPGALIAACDKRLIV